MTDAELEPQALSDAETASQEPPKQSKNAVDQEATGELSRFKQSLLLFSILLFALCGIAYELIVATISSYFLGNSVFEFSLTIGLFMSSMGLGSYLSRFFHRELLSKFVIVEVLIGLLGGLSGPLLFVAFATTDYFRLLQVVLSISVGTLVGLEIPLLTRYLRQFSSLRVALAHVLSWDYLGSLVGSLSFPLILLPFLGLIGASLAVGVINLMVAVVGVLVFRDQLKRAWAFLLFCLLVFFTHVGLFLGAGGIEFYLDSQLYRDQIIYREQTVYQKLVVTRWRDDVRLFINGNIQFSSADEYRYHEALVHVPMAAAPRREHLLILGGGDGMALREAFKWPEVKSVVMVDLDPAMTDLGREFPLFVELNNGSMSDERLEVVNTDAMNYLEDTDRKFDVVFIDLPDPSHESLSKLYSVEFYRLVAGHLSPGGVAVSQSTSPYYSRRAFWSIHRSMEEGFCLIDAVTCPVEGHVLAYHVNVPNFGDWGFNLASRQPLPLPESLNLDLPVRFLTERLIPELFVFPKDEAELEVEPNRLIAPVLLDLYLEDWAQWNL